MMMAYPLVDGYMYDFEIQVATCSADEQNRFSAAHHPSGPVLLRIEFLAESDNLR